VIAHARVCRLTMTRLGSFVWPCLPTTHNGTGCSPAKQRIPHAHLVASLAVYSSLKAIGSLVRNINTFIGCHMVVHLNNATALSLGDVLELFDQPAFRARARLNPQRLHMREAHRASPNSLVDIHAANFGFAESAFSAMTHFLLVGEDERFIRMGVVRCTLSLLLCMHARLAFTFCTLFNGQWRFTHSLALHE
jgi:hypothetical protein